MTNLLFPARGDGTLVLGLPGPSVKEKKENKDKDMFFFENDRCSAYSNSTTAVVVVSQQSS